MVIPPPRQHSYVTAFWMKRYCSISRRRTTGSTTSSSSSSSSPSKGGHSRSTLSSCCSSSSFTSSSSSSCLPTPRLPLYLPVIRISSCLILPHSSVIVTRNSCSSSNSSGGAVTTTATTATATTNPSIPTLTTTATEHASVAQLTTSAISSSSYFSTFSSWTMHHKQRQLQRIFMAMVMTGISFTIGFTLGQQYRSNGNQNDDTAPKQWLLPNGLPRTCCNSDDDDDNSNDNSNDNCDTSTSTGDTNHSSPKSLFKPDSHPPPSAPPPLPSHSRPHDTTPSVKELQDQLSLLTEQQQFIQRLRRMIGKENVIIVDDGDTNTTKTAPYLKGARIVHTRPSRDTISNHHHHITIIVTPQQLHHVVNIIEACVQQNTMAQCSNNNTATTTNNNNNNSHCHYTCTVIPQGQNTGLTGGSTPRYHYDNHNHMTILLSLKHLNAIFPLDDGQRVCCMAGVGLASVRTFFLLLVLNIIIINHCSCGGGSRFFLVFILLFVSCNILLLLLFACIPISHLLSQFYFNFISQ